MLTIKRLSLLTSLTYPRKQTFVRELPIGASAFRYPASLLPSAHIDIDNDATMMSHPLYDVTCSHSRVALRNSVFNIFQMPRLYWLITLIITYALIRDFTV